MTPPAIYIAGRERRQMTKRGGSLAMRKLHRSSRERRRMAARGDGEHAAAGEASATGAAAGPIALREHCGSFRSSAGPGAHKHRSSLSVSAVPGASRPR